MLHVLVSVPPPQLFEHAPKSDHPPSSVVSPVMPSATRQMGWVGTAMTPRVPPHNHPANHPASHFCMRFSEHHKPNTIVHKRQQPVLAQACVLHAPIASPTHPLPPFAGAGLLQVLLLVPPPQALEHTPNRDHPPSSVLLAAKPPATWHNHQQHLFSRNAITATTITTTTTTKANAITD